MCMFVCDIIIDMSIQLIKSYVDNHCELHAIANRVIKIDTIHVHCPCLIAIVHILNTSEHGARITIFAKWKISNLMCI